ncbi:MAG TPA: hypothetical protein VIL84_10080 [Devosiaceae bacterium]
MDRAQHLHAPDPRPAWAKWGTAISAAAAVFGGVTIVTAAATLFGPQQFRTAAGSIVYFVLWFNFLAGFAYLIAAYGLFRRLRWAGGAAAAIALATSLVALAFVVHVASGGAFSWRTPGALALRVAFWAAVAVAFWGHVRGGESDAQTRR